MEKFEREAKKLCEAIKAFQTRPEAIENFESYLSMHFDTWLNKYADTPEGLASEFLYFANICEED